MGTTGTFARRATSSAPRWNRPTRPSSERVPSGKIATSSPRSTASIIAASAPRSPVPRFTVMPPQVWITQPMNGFSFSVSRATNVTRRRKVVPMNGMSSIDWWFDTRSAPPSRGTFSSPRTTLRCTGAIRIFAHRRTKP
ncbi:MAG: hypothetical protein R3F34_02930 [Planctomycetota bacterium]